MGYKVNFLDNQEVKAADLNDIRIGLNIDAQFDYTDFQDGETYGVGNLNRITKSIMNPGIAKNYPSENLYNARECYPTLTQGNPSTLHINAGRVFFASGATLTVDSSGIDLTVPESENTQYVYFFYSANGNVAGVKIAETKTESDTVDIATISANGTLTDTRQYAYAKNASVLPNQYQTINQAVPVHTSGTQTIALPTGFKKFVFARKINEGTYSSLVFLDCEANKIYTHSGSSGHTGTHTASSATSFITGTFVRYDPDHHSLIFSPVPSGGDYDFNVEINCM